MGRGQSCLRSCTGASGSVMGLVLVPSPPCRAGETTGSSLCWGLAGPGLSSSALGKPNRSRGCRRKPQGCGTRSCLWLQQVGRVPPPRAEGTCGPPVRVWQAAARLAGQAAAPGLAPLLRVGWRAGGARGSTHAFADTSASPPLPACTRTCRHAPGLRTGVQATLRSARPARGGGWAHTWPPHACEPPRRRTHASSPPPASRAEPAAPSEPSSAERLFLRLHNAELPLRWERRSRDARQGTGHPAWAPGCTASSEPTPPGGKREREASLCSGRLQPVGSTGGEGKRDTVPSAGCWGWALEPGIQAARRGRR